MTTDSCHFRPAAIPVTVATSPSQGSGLGGHFEVWHYPLIFKDVDAVNVEKITGINFTCTVTRIAAGYN